MFYEKIRNNFLNSEHKIIYAEKRVNNFLNNAKQKNNFMQNARNSLCRKQWIIFMRKQWPVLINAKNRFYECSKHIQIYSKHDVQRANFINIKIDFINVGKQICSLWNLNMKKHSDLAFKFRKHDFTRCFIRKQ